MMLPYWEWLNPVDHFSICVAGFFALILISYLFFVLYFVLFKAKLVANKAMAEKVEAQDHLIDDVHKKIFV